MEESPVLRIIITPNHEDCDGQGRTFVLRIEIFDDPDAITQEQKMRIAEDICNLMGKILPEENTGV